MQLVKVSHENHEGEVPDQPVSLHSQYSKEGPDKFLSVRFSGVCGWVFLVLIFSTLSGESDMHL